MTPAALLPHREAEIRYAWQLYDKGPVREMYDRKDRMGVVFVLECDTVEEARGHLAELPFVREGLIDFEIIPLGPFSYFESLFQDRPPA